MLLIEVNGYFIDTLLKPLFRGFSTFGDKVFFENKDFPFTDVLEDNYDVINAEFQQMQDRINDFAPFQEISPDQSFISNDDKWKMFFLKAGNVRFERNCQEFPETMKILDSNKNVVSAYFSVIGPRKMLIPHNGPWCGILRMHMGIQIPTEGKGCVLVVDEKEYRWEEGKVVVFDDTYMHTAVNMTYNDRIVLFLDYLRPLPLPLRLLNRLILYSAKFLPYFRRPVTRHRKWEERFYGDAL